MKRIIYANTEDWIEAAKDSASVIKKIGKYLMKNIDGAYKIEFHSMDCDVFMRMYYQVPNEIDTFDEMKFIINITSYSNKYRINLTEDTKYEKTIGQLIIPPEQSTELELIKRKVLTMIKKSINKEFNDFDFVY